MDAWLEESFDPANRVTSAAIAGAAKDAIVIPCPPFDSSREVSAGVIASSCFTGYEQKSGLYPIHAATIVRYLSEI